MSSLDSRGSPRGRRRRSRHRPARRPCSCCSNGDVEWDGVRRDVAPIVFDGPRVGRVPPAGQPRRRRSRSDAGGARARGDMSTAGLPCRRDGAVARRLRPTSSCTTAAHRDGSAQVHDVVADNVRRAERLIVGETFNEPGQWSSFPPHKHDGGDGEPALEEVYYFRFDRPRRLRFPGPVPRSARPEHAVFLRHGTRRRHPRRVSPGVRGAGVPPLLPVGAGRRRRAAARDARGPAHRWLHDA